MPETRISNGTARQARKALNAFAVNHKDAECIIRTTGGHLTAVVTANHGTPVGMVRLGEAKETVEAARIEPKRLADLIKPQGHGDVTMLIHDGMLTCGTLSTPTAPVEDADQSCLDIDLKRRAQAKPCLRVKAQPFAAAIRDAATTTEPGRPVLGCVHISGDDALTLITFTRDPANPYCHISKYRRTEHGLEDLGRDDRFDFSGMPTRGVVGRISGCLVGV